MTAAFTRVPHEKPDDPHGSHDIIDVTYGELGRWVADHALAVAGPVRETYFVGPRDTPAAEERRTEIGWPVFRVAGAGPRTV
ncbi:hypothetical protein ACFY8K_28345 [Streptomyces misionensis]|uniref:hypothetical protein n=1 Tax=Streptomyces misionensis TaxID=67331 RepID=UPI0036CF22F5